MFGWVLFVVVLIIAALVLNAIDDNNDPWDD